MQFRGVHLSMPPAARQRKLLRLNVSLESCWIRKGQSPVSCSRYVKPLISSGKTYTYNHATCWPMKVWHQRWPVPRRTTSHRAWRPRNKRSSAIYRLCWDAAKKNKNYLINAIWSLFGSRRFPWFHVSEKCLSRRSSAQTLFALIK